jgi:lipoprotein signal peptidase
MNTLNKAFYTALSWFAIFFSAAAFVVFIDQFCKQKIRHAGGFFVCNSGAAWGVPLPSALFWLIAGLFILAASLYSVYLYKRALLSLVFVLGVAFFVGGILSNLLDRYFLGCVLDYITLLGRSFPVFNVADASIFGGSCLIILSLPRLNS